MLPPTPLKVAERLHPASGLFPGGSTRLDWPPHGRLTSFACSATHKTGARPAARRLPQHSPTALLSHTAYAGPFPSRAWPRPCLGSGGPIHGFSAPPADRALGCRSRACPTVRLDCHQPWRSRIAALYPRALRRTRTRRARPLTAVAAWVICAESDRRHPGWRATDADLTLLRSGELIAFPASVAALDFLSADAAAGRTNARSDAHRLARRRTVSVRAR